MFGDDIELTLKLLQKAAFYVWIIFTWFFFHVYNLA